MMPRIQSGFVFNVEGVRIGFVTDLGYMPTSCAHASARTVMAWSSNPIMI